MTTNAILAEVTKAHDGARILWRWFLASEDRRANEGHVREFSAAGDYVRIAASANEEDKGEWLRTTDIKLVAVLAEHVDIVKKPKRRRRREDGEAWKDGDGFDFDT